jgi:glucose/arabinose dehydrogenase
MSHSLRSKSFAVLSLVFASAGLIAVACSSDKSPNTDNPALTPGAGNENPSNSAGTTGNGTEPGTGTNPDTTPGNPTAGNPTGANNEGQNGELPIAPGEPPVGPPDEPGTTPPVTPPATVTANCSAPEGAVPNLSLELVAGNLNQPIYVTQAPGDNTRLFIMEKGGNVRVLVNGEVQQAPFINVSSLVTNSGEQGLLGMAFHPDYATNGLFYLHFSGLTGQGMARDTVVAEFRVTEDRSVADLASRRNVLGIVQPESNHNGGEIAFGPDKMLYLGFGDGGGGGDAHGNPGNGQSLNTLLAKILRIDPLGRAVNNAYSVPSGNLSEVMGQQALPEIWAYGLRNPWRFSFDACNGDLYIADVGQNTLEEIDFLPAAADRTIAAGANFGWRLMEGPNCRPGDTTCNAQTQGQMGLTQPVDSYARTVGTSVTGGYVYRGSNVPGLRGNYIYADYNSARFFRFRVENGQIADRVEITDQMRPATGNVDNISSFGTDNAGEMYVAQLTPGAVYRVVAAP